MLKQITVVLFVMFGYVAGSDDDGNCTYYKGYSDCGFLQLNCDLCPEDDSDYCGALVENGCIPECPLPEFTWATSQPSTLLLNDYWDIDCDYPYVLKLLYTCNNGVFDVSPVCVSMGGEPTPEQEPDSPTAGAGCHVDLLPDIANEAGTNVELAHGETATVCCNGPNQFLVANVTCTEDGLYYHVDCDEIMVPL